MMTDDRRTLTEADLAAIRHVLDGPAERPKRTDRIVKVAAEAAAFALGNPELSPTEIARRMGRRKDVVLKAVKAARSVQATQHLCLPPVSPERRFPSSGNPCDGGAA